ncbi:MFS transporter [Saccharopolyspora cebuensis]|uniref:MFS transporter n=1 Tax=Saccharopolyspora cebuensis TaxID=418759 RepID=A0ABV4CM64_9PSEU
MRSKQAGAADPLGTEATRTSGTRWWALVVIGLAQLLVVLDATIVNIALPSAQRELGLTDASRQWVITAYTLAFGGLLLLGGRVSDRFGAKRVFLIGLVGFAVASVVAGAAVGPGMLFAGRALQGVFAAVLAPAALSLLSTTFTEPAERGTAFGVYGALSGGGAAVGLLAGGVLTEYLDWRWCLYVNVPVAAVAVLAGLPLLRNPSGTRRAKLDVASALTSSAGVTAAVGGFAAAEASGWTAPRVLALLGASALLLVLFTLLAARRPFPLLPLRILADRARGGAFLAVALSQVAMFGLFLFMTYYLQTVLGYSPVLTGVAFLPLTAGIIVGSTLIAGRLLPRTGPRSLMVTALLVAALGMGLLTRIGTDTSTVFVTLLLPAQILLGLGLGGVMMPAMSTATDGVSEHDAGAASATVNAAQQIGGSLGTALLNTIATTATASYLARQAPFPEANTAGTVHGFAVALTIAAILLLATAALTAALMPRTRRDPAQPADHGNPADNETP